MTPPPFDLLLAFSHHDVTPWRDAFARALPEARVHVWPDTPEAVDVVAAWRPPAAVFDRVRVRHAIANLGAGVDALLKLPNLPASVPVLRLEDAGMAVQMAEYVTLAVLRAYREVPAYETQQREGRWVQRERVDKAAFGIGILGLGVLGQAVARPLLEFGFPVHGWSRTPRELAGITAHTGATGLATLLASVRMVVCLLPSTPATRGLLDRATLGMLPRGAHLVNVARGDLVVDDDLLALLDDGHLASATLDVFHAEPLPPAHPFWRHPRVTLTPHVSAATDIGASVAQVADKCRAVLRGSAVAGVVDRHRGY